MSVSQAVPTELQDGKVGTRLKLASLWVSLMFVYVYADFLHFYQPGDLQSALDGFMGPFPVTQTALLMAAVLMAIPAAMVFLTLAMKAAVSRWANVVFGILYTAVNISNVIGETWYFYWFLVLIEIAMTLLIVFYAWTWSRK